MNIVTKRTESLKTERSKAEDYTVNLGNQLLVLNNQRKGTIYVSLKLSSSRSQIMESN